MYDLSILQNSVVQFLKHGHKNGDICDICFQPFQALSKTAFSINEDVLREVLRYLFTRDEDIERNIKRLNSCEDCRKQFINLTQLSYQLEKLMEQFNHLRSKVGKLVILQSLSKSEEDWEEWAFETKYFELWLLSFTSNEEDDKGRGSWNRKEIYGC